MRQFLECIGSHRRVRKRGNGRIEASSGLKERQKERNEVGDRSYEKKWGSLSVTTERPREDGAEI